MTAFNDGPPRAARDVPAGTSWAFKEHRTMAEIIAGEVSVEKSIPEQKPVECNALVLAVGLGIGRVLGYVDGVPAVQCRHIDGLVRTTSAMLFVLPEPLAPPLCAFSIVGGRA